MGAADPSSIVEVLDLVRLDLISVKATVKDGPALNGDVAAICTKEHKISAAWLGRNKDYSAFLVPNGPHMRGCLVGAYQVTTGNHRRKDVAANP